MLAGNASCLKWFSDNTNSQVVFLGNRLGWVDTRILDTYVRLRKTFMSLCTESFAEHFASKKHPCLGLKQKSGRFIMAQWLRRASRGHGVYCPWSGGRLNPSWFRLWVYGNFIGNNAHLAPKIHRISLMNVCMYNRTYLYNQTKVLCQWGGWIS